MDPETRVSTPIPGFVRECKTDPVVVYTPGIKTVVATGTRVEVKVLKTAQWLKSARLTMLPEMDKVRSMSSMTS